MKFNSDITVGNVLASFLIVTSVAVSYANTRVEISVLDEKIKALPALIDKLEQVTIELAKHEERLKAWQTQSQP